MVQQSFILICILSWGSYFRKKFFIFMLPCWFWIFISVNFQSDFSLSPEQGYLLQVPLYSPGPRVQPGAWSTVLQMFSRTLWDSLVSPMLALLPRAWLKPCLLLCHCFALVLGYYFIRGRHFRTRLPAFIVPFLGLSNHFRHQGEPSSAMIML